jgi:hypothetical protein
MEDIEELTLLHNEACAEKQQLFIHPISGLSVMTSYGLLKNGTCCGRKCLFCPYRHHNVKNHKCTSSTCHFQMKEGNEEEVVVSKIPGRKRKGEEITDKKQEKNGNNFSFSFLFRFTSHWEMEEEKVK